MELALTNILLALVVLALIGLQVSAMIFAYMLLKHLDQRQEAPKIFLSTTTNSANSTPAASVPVLLHERLQKRFQEPAPNPVEQAEDTELSPRAQCGYCQSMIFGEPIRAVVERGSQKLVYKCPQCSKEVAVSQAALTNDQF